jgi:hypothetical protein
MAHILKEAHQRMQEEARIRGHTSMERQEAIILKRQSISHHNADIGVKERVNLEIHVDSYMMGQDLQ